jgi:hypothetical protein
MASWRFNGRRRFPDVSRFQRRQTDTGIGVEILGQQCPSPFYSAWDVLLAASVECDITIDMAIVEVLWNAGFPSVIGEHDILMPVCYVFIAQVRDNIGAY